jgi:hypothetical protein
LLEYDRKSGHMAIHLPALDERNNYVYNHKLIFAPDFSIKNEQDQPVGPTQLYDLTGLNLNTLIRAYENIQAERESRRQLRP